MLFSLEIFKDISTVVVFHSWFQFDLDTLAFVACLKMTEGQNPWSFRTYNCKKRKDGTVILFNFSGQRNLLRTLSDIHTSITKQTPNPEAIDTEFLHKNEFADCRKA